METQDILKKISKTKLIDIRAQFCYYMQELMNSGDCNSLLNDDDGHWAIASDGIQTIGQDDVQTTFFCEKKFWKKTPEQALKFYAQDSLKEN